MSKAVQKVEIKEQAPAIAEANALISMIERAARDPSVDIAKMERLFEMSERVRAREAEAAFNAAMSAAQAALIPVVRNRKNIQTNSKYADLSAIAEQAMPIIHQHGFGLIFSEFKSERPEHMGVACKVTHSAGHSERHEFNVPMDGKGIKGNANKTDTHAYGSSFSYGRRYATCGVFNIATKDDDGNAAGARKQAEPENSISEKQLKELNELYTKMENPAAAAQITLEHFRAESLSELTERQFNSTRQQLRDKLGITD